MLFSLTRSLIFLAEIIGLKQEETVKSIIGKKFFLIAKIWEKSTKRGILTELIASRSMKSQKSGNYDIIFSVFENVLIYM